MNGSSPFARFEEKSWMADPSILMEDLMRNSKSHVVLLGAGLTISAAGFVLVIKFADPTSHALAASVAVEYKNCSDTAQGQTCMPNKRPAKLTEYLECSSEAEVRILSLSEALACTEALLFVKLSFVAGVDPASYRQMPIEDQIKISRRSYKAFSKWRNDNAELLTTVAILDSETSTLFD